MEHEIKTMQDVKRFLEQIATEIDDFHPLEDFGNYTFPNTHFRRYTDTEIEQRNRCLDQCIAVCIIYTEDCFTYLTWYFGLMKAQMCSTV